MTDDLWQRIAHAVGSTKTADVVMTIVQPELISLRAEMQQLRDRVREEELEQLRARCAKAERAVGHLTDRYRGHEETIARVEAYAHELRHKDAMGLLAALGTLDQVPDVEAGLREVLDHGKEA